MISLMAFVVFCTVDSAFSNLHWKPNSLIIADDDFPTSSLHEVHFANGDFTQHELREIDHGYPFTSALVYDPDTKTLFWSGATRDSEDSPWRFHIFSTVNDSGVVNQLYSGSEGINGLAIDSRKELLFFSGGSGTYNVNVMKTNGENPKVLANVYDDCFMSPSRLALDTERLNVYVACYYRFVRMTYGGNVAKEIDSGSRIWNVDIHEPTDTVIYSDFKYLHSSKIDGGTVSIKIPHDLPQIPSGIVVHGSFLFITFLEELKEVRIYDVITGRKVATVGDIPGDYYNIFSLVYIPPE